jgi:hypothetical protein
LGAIVGVKFGICFVGVRPLHLAGECIGCSIVDTWKNRDLLVGFAASVVNGHYGGSADSVGVLPYLPNFPILMEFKTHNTKSFNTLVNKGVKSAKYDHFTQMCSYGKHYGFKYGLYVAVCKDDDELHIELIELDWMLSDDSIRKAEEIIFADKPPQAVSLNPSYYRCKMCSFQGICHFNEPVEVNCRSCKKAKPIDNGKWYCHQYNSEIPEDHLIKGCQEHVSIAL